MKKLYMITAFFIFLFFSSVKAFAVPSLQLDITGGYYNDSGDARYDDETVIAPGDIFTLYALMDITNKTSLADIYTISMALFPGIDETNPPPDLGPFIFNGQTINVVGDMVYGNPGIQAHGVFPTYYTIYQFSFKSSDTVGTYNTQDNPGQFDNFFPGTGLYYAAFEVDTSNLSDEFSIHFDLFNDNTKAPFSHDASDAQSDPPPPVPEPGTFILLGLGLLGLAGFTRRKYSR